MAPPEAWLTAVAAFDPRPPGRLRAPGGLCRPLRRPFGRPGGAGRLAGLVVRTQHGFRPAVRPPAGRPGRRFLFDRPGGRLPRRAAYREDSNVLETCFPHRDGSVRLTESLNSGSAGRLPWCELGAGWKACPDGSSCASNWCPAPRARPSRPGCAARPMARSCTSTGSWPP